MRTIVEYTSHTPPANEFPKRIVSPPQSSGCCFREMEPIGTPRRDGRWVFQYRRCRQCGFTVRAILRRVPEEADLTALRKALAHMRVGRLAAGG